MSVGQHGRHGIRWWHGLLVLVGVALLVSLAWPWAASAYSVERAGRWLAAGRTGPGVERQLDRALHWDPHNAQAYRLRAQLYERRGNPIAAVEALAGYAILRPADPLGVWALALACEGLAAPELAQVAGQPCGHDDENQQAALVRLWRAGGYAADSFVDAGNALRQEGDSTVAEAYYHRALVLDSGSAAAWYGLGEVWQARGQRDAALEAYGRATAVGSDTSVAAQAHHRRGKMLADAGQWERAAAELAQAVDLVPEEGEYHYDYGWYLYKAGAPTDVAVVELETAAGLMPRSPWPHVRLAAIMFDAKDYDAMLVRAEDAIEVQPGQVWGWLLQGRALDRLGRFAEAESALRQALELAPEEAAAHDALGHVLAQKGDLPAAIAAYEQAVALSPGNVDYHLRLANSYRANGEIERAMETYRRVINLDPDNLVATQALEALAP